MPLLRACSERLSAPLATVTPSAIPSFMRISAYNESGNNIVISDNTEETLNQLTMTLRGLTSTVKGLNNTIMAAMGKVVDKFCKDGSFKK